MIVRLRESNNRAERKLNSVPFRTDKTGMSGYDDIMKNTKYYMNIKNKVANIEYMSPSEYIKRCSKGFRKSESLIRMSRSHLTIEGFADKMMKGTKFDLPVLDYAEGFTQEGLHRALAAEMLGVKKIPVLVVEQWKSEEEFRVPLIYDGQGNVKIYADEEL